MNGKKNQDGGVRKKRWANVRIYRVQRLGRGLECIRSKEKDESRKMEE